MNLRLPVSVIVVLSACQPKVTVGGDYTLELLPHLPLDQGEADPLDGADLTVRVNQDGKSTSYTLGPSDSAQWSAPDVAALTDATIGLLWTKAGATDDPLDFDDLRAWGLSPAVSIDADTRRVPVMVGAYGLPGQYGSLEAAQTPLGGAAVRLPDGDVLIFGGTDDVVFDSGDDDLTHKASSAVLRLRLTDDDYTFERVGDMPKVQVDNDLERVGATATLVTVDGKTQVLVVGGRTSWANPAVLKAGAFLWDPASDTSTWSDTTLSDGRFLGGAAPFPDGRVAVFGGFNAQNDATFSWQIFDPAIKRFDAPEAHTTSVALGAVGAAWVNLGDDGILVCGGATKSGPKGAFVPTAVCGTLGTNGDVLAQPNIGGASQNVHMWSAMTRLRDGRILLTGGVDNAIASVGGTGDNAVPAVKDAYLLDLTAPASWTKLPDMNHERAMHTMITRPDGHVLILGGLAQGTSIPIASAVPAAASCGELYDPDANTFTDLERCDTVGVGGLPTVATSDGYGAFVLSGFVPQGGGRDWGVVPLGPTP